MKIRGFSMDVCPDCGMLGKKSSTKELYPCALCGEMRCADHSVWTPAHELDHHSEEATRVRKLFKGKKQSGWFAFCGKGRHIPRGLSTRFGKNKGGGRIVELVIGIQDKGGLEFFNRWEVGIIEDATEKRWSEEHYTLSCSLAPAMVAISSIVRSGGPLDSIQSRIYENVITGIAARKEFVHSPSLQDYLKVAEDATTIQDYAGILCSYCGIVPCLNRQREYYDSKQFKKFASAQSNNQA